jgi:hypothetical protein
MDEIMAQLINLGAVALPDQEQDARLVTITQVGVAPDDFYSSTIYPTEVRVAGEWIRVQHQRMDGVVVVSPTASAVVADCKLLRDLQLGDWVVVGYDGIRSIRSATDRTRNPQEEFSFMGSGVSSERRVELIVEQVAWELRRLRDQGGKVAVVAGPVVIHTGGGAHLARLIREGYVQALLGAMRSPFTTLNRPYWVPPWG